MDLHRKFADQICIFPDPSFHRADHKEKRRRDVSFFSSRFDTLSLYVKLNPNNLS